MRRCATRRCTVDIAPCEYVTLLLVVLRSWLWPLGTASSFFGLQRLPVNQFAMSSNGAFSYTQVGLCFIGALANSHRVRYPKLSSLSIVHVLKRHVEWKDRTLSTWDDVAIVPFMELLVHLLKKTRMVSGSAETSST